MNPNALAPGFGGDVKGCKTRMKKQEGKALSLLLRGLGDTGHLAVPGCEPMLLNMNRIAIGPSFVLDTVLPLDSHLRVCLMISLADEVSHPAPGDVSGPASPSQEGAQPESASSRLSWIPVLALSLPSQPPSPEGNPAQNMPGWHYFSLGGRSAQILTLPIPPFLWAVKTSPRSPAQPSM